MATTCFFEEEVFDQDRERSLDVELGRSSYYSGSELKGGKIGEDSIYLKVNGESVIMDTETARRFVDAVVSVGRYHGFID